MNKILIIIPAYNEEESLPGVIQDLRKHIPEADILVVDDGSRDRTADIARQAGVSVTSLPFNLGIGGAMQAGYKYAFEKEYDVAIQVDGDGQHAPKEIRKLFENLIKNGNDMTIGSRFLGGSEYRASLMRRVGIAILSMVVSVLIRQKVTDPTSGFRAASRKAIQLFTLDYPQDYPEPEVLVLLSRNGLKIEEVPVKIEQRSFGESSITNIRAIYYMIKVLLAILVDCFKKKTPLT
jgi:glycosyltransferase involved in cell wall biosynthesis